MTGTPQEARSGPTLSAALLGGVRRGDRESMDELFRRVYDELRALAAGQLGRERPGHTLQPTALVHEAFVKLSGGGAVHVEDRRHFVAVAARAMRQVLVDHARRRMADKRGGGMVRTTLGGDEPAIELDPAGMVDLDRALEELDERQRRVVELRFFAGLEETEVAHVLGVTPRTVRRDWVKARAWLYAALYPAEADAADERPPATGR